jgi:hypothetical protein
LEISSTPAKDLCFLSQKAIANKIEGPLAWARKLKEKPLVPGRKKSKPA